MIAFLEGTLSARTLTGAYVNVGGVGFEIYMSQNSLSKLPEVGSTVTVLTYLAVREDAMVLYGFISAEEKEAFQKLLGVSGVGPKVALSVLSYYSPEQLALAIQQGDVSRIAKVPGIGKKTAGRIVVDLKGSFESVGENMFEENSSDENPGSAYQEVYDALLSMGFTSTEAQLALKDAPREATVNSLLQYALRKLG